MVCRPAKEGVFPSNALDVSAMSGLPLLAPWKPDLFRFCGGFLFSELTVFRRQIRTH